MELHSASPAQASHSQNGAPQELRPSRRRTPRQKILFVFLFAIVVFFLPYFVPVHPAVSLSYIAGYSNRAALLLFLLGTLAFAVFTHGEPSATESSNKPLPVSWLIGALLGSAFLFLLARHFSIHSLFEGTDFFLDRQLTLATGLKLYRGVDFMYGPLLLYPGLWLARAMHTSQAAGYFTWVALQWLFGISMLWASVRLLEIPVRLRPLLFSLLMIDQLGTLLDFASNYIPFRADTALFCTVVVVTVQRRYRNAIATALVAAAAFGCGLLVSMEQAIGLGFGLTIYLALLAWKGKQKNDWLALALYLASAAAFIAIAVHAGMFDSFKAWSAGGFALPLLPSINNCLRLFPYVVAGCVFYRAARQHQWQSAPVALGLVGMAMLPYALGRCDLRHLDNATPAFVLGVAGILTMPSVRRWWVPLFLVFAVLPTTIITYYEPGAFVLARLENHLGLMQHPKPSTAPLHLTAPPPPPNSQKVPTEDDLPCDRTYYMPSLIVAPSAQFHPECQDRGYYRGISDDVFTPEAYARKIEEMRERPTEPLLLENTPLTLTFGPLENDMNVLHWYEVSAFIPPRRHDPITPDPIRLYIESHYTPGPLVAKGTIQIWYPNSTPSHTP